MTQARHHILISAAELAAAIVQKTPIILLHIVDDQAQAKDVKAFLQNAQPATLAQDFSSPATREGGKRPLPDLAELQTKARAWGMTLDRPIVVYDETGGAQAARAWWTLRWAGVSHVRLLEGGLQSAVAEGLNLQSAPAPARHDGDVSLSAGHMPTLTAHAAAALAAEGLLFDARGRANYEGDPAIAGTGHIPGAKNIPADRHLTDDKHFASRDDLLTLYNLSNPKAGIGIYCGSGNAAAQAVTALAAAGIEAALYVGSWSAWSADSDRPIATGSAP